MSGSAEELSFFDTDQIVAEGQGRIRPRARILRTIGAELISSEVVAVIELVRNCYDADATLVTLAFENPEDPDNAKLSIKDNGHGMTREILLGPWLEPATDHKSGLNMGTSAGERSPRGRRRLGSKGVGRFASQRLGSHLTLITRADSESTELSASFDWSELEQGKYLDQLQIPWRESLPTHLGHSHGTHLLITGLRDRWTPDRFDKLRLSLGRLISPTLEENFQIMIEINGAKEAVEPTLDLRESMYAIEGQVEPGGECHIRYTDLSGTREHWERTVIWPDGDTVTCGPFRFRIAAWDLDSAPLRHFLKQKGKKLGLREFRRVVRDHSGIALYRDDFRILPYGEPDNDWLRLDRRRVNNPTMRLSNNQILGTIHLTADDNPELRDQTNREGLVANDAYGHLQEVVLELLGYLETRRFAARRALDLDWQRRVSSLPVLESGQEDRLGSILDGLDREGNGIKDVLGEIRSAFDQLRESSADVVRHYAGLASSGQLSGIVFRQMRHPIRQIRSDLDLAIEDLSSGQLNDDEREDVLESLKIAVQHLDTMTQRMEKLDPLAIGGRGRRVSEVRLRGVLGTVVEAYEHEFVGAGVTLHLSGSEDLKCQTNPEVAQQVLANLLDNALYWATLGESESPLVCVELNEQGFIIFDSGPGIPETIRRAIFEPHFTTRDSAHGLGLTLVKDLLKTIGGRVILEDPHQAKFKVVLQAE